LRIISYNIKKGGRGRASAIASVLTAHQPDVVVLQEATDPTIVKDIAQQAEFPHCASGEGYSVAFLSKTEPTLVKWHAVRGIRSPFLEIHLQDSNLRIFGVHLTAFLVNRLERKRAHEIRSLLEVVGDDPSHVLIGDFNTIINSEDSQFRKMPLWLRLMIMANGGIRPRALQLLLDAGYVDIFRHFNANNAGFTLPTPDPNTRLDYAFVLGEFISRMTACRAIRTPDEVNIASDHYPLLLEMT